jgi:hypothetical protein
MKHTYGIILFALITITFISCERSYPPNVDSRANVYKQLSLNFGSVDSIVKKVETIKEVQELEKPLKVLRSQDEMQIITEMVTASIDGNINVDSLKLTPENTIFLKNNNNAGRVGYDITDSIYREKGYKVTFMKGENNYRRTDALSIWRHSSNNYEPLQTNDSITASTKKSIESLYEEDLKIIQNLKYIVFEEDALLVPPVIDLESDGFSSGYILTHLYAYDINTLEKVGQMMIVSANSDEISYSSFNQSRNDKTMDKLLIKGQLRHDLIGQKSKTIDSIFTYKETNL